MGSAARHPGERITTTGGSIAASLFVATLLMIVFLQRYPRHHLVLAVLFVLAFFTVAWFAILFTDRQPPFSLR